MIQAKTDQLATGMIYSPGTPPSDMVAASAVVAPAAMGRGECTRPEVPYTHAIHAKRCREAAELGLVLSGQHVQVKSHKTICCARIVTAWDTADGLEMWQLDLIGPIRGRMSSPASRVRQCSGLDGRCTCAAEKADASGAGVARPAVADFERGLTPDFSQAGVVAPPESLMCEKTPVSMGV